MAFYCKCYPNPKTLFVIFIINPFVEILSLKKAPKQDVIKLFQIWPSGFPQADVSMLKNFSPQEYSDRFPFLNEFSTLADFFLFQLTGKARENYLYLSQEINSNYLKNEENKNELTLFLFADIKNSKKLLSASDSPWKCFLIVDDFEVSPESIELITEDFSLIQTLGALFDNKKKIYKIVFSFKNANLEFLSKLKAEKPFLKLKYLNLVRLIELPAALD